jgi:hypothetical protein
MTAPRFRNFARHDLLFCNPRNEAQTREDVIEGTSDAFAEDSIILVFTPAFQWTFIDSPQDFGRAEFSDWLETVTGVAFDAGTWPDLHLPREPEEDWFDHAEAMPCRFGQSLWDLLTPPELARYVRGGALPPDVGQRRSPDTING